MWKVLIEIKTFPKRNVLIITVAGSEITFNTKIVRKIVTDRSHELKSWTEKSIIKPYCIRIL